MNETEPLLAPNPNRYVLFPLQYQDVYDFWILSQQNIWTVKEVELKDDLADWAKLNEGERRLLKHVLAFFAGSDGAVNENIDVNFSKEIENAEVRMVYSAQAFIESVHSEMYSTLILTYEKDREEQNRLFQSIQTMPCVGKKTEWAQKYMNKNIPFANRLAAFAFVEGLFFSASFASIFYIKKRGLMPGLSQSNTYIARDEALHTNFACLLYSKLVNRMKEKDIHEMVREAVDVERGFVRDAIPVELIGMSSSEMCTYVEYCADRLLTLLGYDPIWNVQNPFDWMEMISVSKKQNFFERRNTQYKKGGVDAEGAVNKSDFSMEEDV